MSITNQGVTEALFILDRCNLNAAKQGQSQVWAEIISDARPNATDADLMDAVKAIAKRRNAEAKGGTWITPGDVNLEMRNIRTRNLELAEKYARQIERTGHDVSDDNMRQIMRDTGAGMDASEVARRAQERAEGQS